MTKLISSRHYITMSHCAKLSRGPLSNKKQLQIFITVASVLHDVHQLSVSSRRKNTLQMLKIYVIDDFIIRTPGPKLTSVFGYNKKMLFLLIFYCILDVLN